MENNVYCLLKLLRKDNSQREMSKLLGVKADDYHKWEVGYKKIKLSEFKQLLELRGFSFQEMALNILGIIDIKENPTEMVKQLEKQFPCDLNQFLDQSGFSESKWWRLKNKSSSISLIDFFKIIHYRTFLLYKVFEYLDFKHFELDFTPRNHEQKIEIFNSYMLQYDFFPQLTASIYLLEVLNQDGLENKANAIAIKLKRPKDLIYNILKNLLDKNILFWTKTNQLDFTTFENNYKSKQNNIGSTLYTRISNSTLQRINPKDENCRYFFRVAPVSKEAVDKIQSLQASMSKEIYNIILNDPPENRTEIINYTTGSFCE